MLDLAFRNILRQRTRTFLTVLGILIGIAAIVALGSISDGLNEMMQKNLEAVAGKIIVFEGEAADGFAGLMMGVLSSEITDDHIDTLGNVGGVKEVVPLLFYVGEMGNTIMDIGWQGIGIQPSKINYFKGENVEMYDGVVLEEGDSGVANIGKDVADRYDLMIGDYFTIKETEFEIVGIIEKTDIQDIDDSVIISMDDMKDVTEQDTYVMAYVIPEDVSDVETVADEINDAEEDLYSVSSVDIARQASDMIGQIRIFTFGIGAIAAIVGGLGVMNTMIMAVMERRREIGVLKAIGATNNLILRQILTESAMISLVGGVLGVLLGLVASIMINLFTGGIITAVVTPTLALVGLLFALLLGLVGGLYPARKAAKLDPVEALRYE